MVKDIQLLGFSLTKIKAVKNPGFDGKLEINSNIAITNIEKIKPPHSKQEALKIEFQFGIDYKELGKVSLEGNLFFSLDSKTLKDALSEWKNKKLPKDLNVIVLNIIIQRASLKAFQIEEELNLPLHVQLPRVKEEQFSEEESKK